MQRLQHNIYRLVLGGAKRKAQDLLESEKKRRKVVEDELVETKNQLQERKKRVRVYKKEVKRAKLILARLTASNREAKVCF